MILYVIINSSCEIASQKLLFETSFKEAMRHTWEKPEQCNPCEKFPMPFLCYKDGLVIWIDLIMRYLQFLKSICSI